ncbi:Histone-lysine N-methyltransferase [Coemansia sp. RSA 1933]|nr:Histone-lysine N-methyltransferase [Coemansia sp. RSA 1933]
MAADRQTQKDSNNNTGKGTASGRNRHTTTANRVVVSLPSNGKVSIGNLVDEGLLLAGNTIACNSWPFRASVTAQGTFEAQWTPLPEDFISPYGTEFMRASFETPSAWATAVCRVMRAQAKAPPKTAHTTGHTDRQEQQGEQGSRAKPHRAKVAKNTASAAGESRVAVNGWTACRVLVSKDDPNRELAERLASLDDSSSGTNPTQASDVIEIPLDALRQELCMRINRKRKTKVKRSPSDSADGGLKQPETKDREESDSDNSGSPGSRTMAELSGAVEGLARRVESDLALGCVKQRRAAAMAADAISAASVAPPGSESAAAARKEMHSRKRKSIPDMSRHSKLSRIPSDNTETDGTTDDESHRLGEHTRAVLARFDDRAQTLKRMHPDLRTLRYQRKQRLKRSIASALDAWERQRRRNHRPIRVCATDDAARAMVAAPLDCGTPVRACVRCATTGDLQQCGGCGDAYHWFCAETGDGGARFVCGACRVCMRCLDDAPQASLMQCGQCSRHMHVHCSGQRATDGEWVCDDCVECLECGVRMSAGADIEWLHDRCLCSDCARQIERARVCPECIATYGSRSVGASMVCCDICGFWVHSECDARLTPDVYDALITLEDAPYVCPTCVRSDGALHPDAGASSASDDDLDDAAVAAIPALPRCLRPTTASAAPAEVDTDAAIATLLASQATLASPAVPPDPEDPGSKIKSNRAIKPEAAAETAEAANLLLSLTRSDVRFDRDRFDIDALEARYCVTYPERLVAGPLVSGKADWRCCALCGLHGDGLQTATTSLGRLVPLATADQSAAATRWAHVECLAWSWGPRPVVTAATTPAAASPPMQPAMPLSPLPTRLFGESPVIPQVPAPLVHFQGALLLDTKDKRLPCTLCGRPGASFHCCAPVACFDTAYHLPCLLLAGTSSPHHALPDQPRYSAGWRRALCAAHAPEFSAMMPLDGAVPSYDHIRVTATIEMPPAVLPHPWATRIGNLLVFSWGHAQADLLGPGLHCLRFCSLGGAPHSLLIRCSAPDTWIGSISPGFPASLPPPPLDHSPTNPVFSVHSLSALLRSLFDRILVDDHSAHSLSIDAAVRHPLRFLGLDRILPDHLSPISRPASD